MAAPIGTRALIAPEFQEIQNVDQTKNPAVMYYAVLNYLRSHPEFDIAKLESLLRRHQCFTYLMAHFPSQGQLGKAEWPPGHEKKYHLYLYVDALERRKDLLRFVTPASKVEQKQKLRACGLSLYHLRDDASDVPHSFVGVLQHCLKQCEAVKNFYLNSDDPGKVIAPGESLHSEFKMVEELLDQGIFYVPTLSSDGIFNGIWTVPREELMEGIEMLGSEYSSIKEVLLEFASWPKSFRHELCFFSFTGGSIRFDLSVQRFIYGMFEDCLKLLNCNGLREIKFDIDFF